MDTHLDIAIKDLDSVGLKGTFYITGGGITYEKLDRWRTNAKNGHELGNHSIFHPCLSARHNWVKPGRGSESYTIDKMLLELETMNSYLYAMDGSKTKTYAYPCNESLAGGQSYLDTLRKLPFFIAARTGGNRVVTDIKTLDLFQVPSLIVEETHLETMIGWVNQALENNGLAVFQFHGVGGEYIKISRENHWKLLAYLKQNQQQVWTATFREVMSYVINERNGPSK